MAEASAASPLTPRVRIPCDVTEIAHVLAAKSLEFRDDEDQLVVTMPLSEIAQVRNKRSEPWLTSDHSRRLRFRQKMRLSYNFTRTTPLAKR